METFLTPTAIIAATVVSFLVGAVWYSPVLFMKAWLKGEGLTKAETPKRSALYLLQVNFYSLVAHACMASVLALIFDLVAVDSLKIALSLGGLISIGFVVSSRFVDMVYTTQGVHYEKKSQYKFLVASGYYIVIISVMSAILFYVSKN